tara:strand:- start:5693 stop:6103 length:411 start_codon:yes stop_codon:yes gene_type:complete
MIAYAASFRPDLIDQVFRKSKLMRPKWDKTHYSDGSTYGERIIQKVLDRRPIYKADEVESYLQYTYQFRFNDVLGKTEVKWNNEWVILEDYQFNSIYRELSKRGAKFPVQKLYGLLESDFVPRFHPFKDYFNNLST